MSDAEHIEIELDYRVDKDGSARPLTDKERAEDREIMKRVVGGFVEIVPRKN